MHKVEAASLQIAERHANPDYALSSRCISEIETKSVAPGIFRLYSLSVIYGMQFTELLSWYGLDLGGLVADSALVGAPPRTHPTGALPANLELRVAREFASASGQRKTTDLGPIVDTPLPLPLLDAAESLTLGYVGTDDTTMYPLIRPGSLVQIDTTCDQVESGPWRSEYERPIYFIATRGGYSCSWCTLIGNHLILQPHPLSSHPVRVLRYPQEADIVGQVVGVAMKMKQELPGPASWGEFETTAMPLETSSFDLCAT